MVGGDVSVGGRVLPGVRFSGCPPRPRVTCRRGVRGASTQAPWASVLPALGAASRTSPPSRHVQAPVPILCWPRSPPQARSCAKVLLRPGVSGVAPASDLIKRRRGSKLPRFCQLKLFVPEGVPEILCSLITCCPNKSLTFYSKNVSKNGVGGMSAFKVRRRPPK